MSTLRIVPVTNSRLQRTALALPWKYSGRDPLWAPPLRGEQRKLMGFAHHAFYERAEAQCFLALRGSEAVGRVLAIVNHAHQQWYHDNLGFVGFFECEDDATTAQSLFSAAHDWLRARGCNHVRGPANPSINYEWGLLVDGFDTPPYFLCTHNPPYYERLWLASGYRGVHDLFSYRGNTGMIPTMDKKHQFIDESIRERFGITLRPLRRDRFNDDVLMFLDIYNASLGGTWGFVPLSASEIREFAGALKHLLVPELTLIAECEGRAIGVCFGLLDYNVPIRQSDGRLFPLGWWRMLRARHTVDRLRVVSANVRPEFQSWGVGITLVRGLIPAMLAMKIDEIDFSWVLESNNLSRKTLEKGGAVRYKTYRIYECVL